MKWSGTAIVAVLNDSQRDSLAPIRGRHGRNGSEDDLREGRPALALRRAFRRAGAKAREYIPAVLRIKVAPGVTDEAGARRPTAAAKHFVRRPEPGLGVFFVRIAH